LRTGTNVGTNALCILTGNPLFCFALPVVAYLALAASDPCSADPCQNGGRCLLHGDFGHSCACPEGYWGDVCERSVGFNLMLALAVISFAALGYCLLQRGLFATHDAQALRTKLHSMMFFNIFSALVFSVASFVDIIFPGNYFDFKAFLGAILVMLTLTAVCGISVVVYDIVVHTFHHDAAVNLQGRKIAMLAMAGVAVLAVFLIIDSFDTLKAGNTLIRGLLNIFNAGIEWITKLIF